MYAYNVCVCVCVYVMNHELTTKDSIDAADATMYVPLGNDIMYNTVEPVYSGHLGTTK